MSTTKAYQRYVEKHWNKRDEFKAPSKSNDDYILLRNQYIMATGLAGETGEVLELLKKEVRNNRTMVTSDLALELGDVLHYLVKIMGHYGLTIDQVMDLNMQKLDSRRAQGKSETAEKELYHGTAQKYQSDFTKITKGKEA